MIACLLLCISIASLLLGLAVQSVLNRCGDPDRHLLLAFMWFWIAGFNAAATFCLA